MSERAIRAGKAFWEISANDSELQKGLKAAQARIKRFGASISAAGTQMTILGGAVLAPLAAATKLFTGIGDQFDKMAGRTGVSVEALSELKYAAERGGASVSDLETALRGMARTMESAGRGTGESVEALEALGLTFAELEKLSPEQRFALLADRLSKMEDPTLRAGTAMKIFGRAGTALLPMLEGGAAGIDAMRQKARDLGLSIATADAKNAAKLTDTLADITDQAKRAMFEIGAALAPTIQELAERAIEAVGAWLKWLAANRELVASWAVSIAKVGAWVAGVGVALVVVGKLTAGVAGLTGALTFMVAHPVVAAIAGLTALGLALHNASTSTAELGDRYSSVGSRIDSVTSKLAGMTKAQRAANEEMRRAALMELQLAIAEQQQNVDVATRQAGQRPFMFFGTPGQYQNHIANLHRIAERETQKLHNLQRRQRELRDIGNIGDPVEVSPSTVAAEPTITSDAIAAAVAAQIAENTPEVPTLPAGVAFEMPAMPEEFTERLDEIAETMRESVDVARQQVDARGTFNAEMAGQLGFGDRLAERTALAAEQMVTLQRQTISAIETSGATFS